MRRGAMTLIRSLAHAELHRKALDCALSDNDTKAGLSLGIDSTPRASRPFCKTET